MKFKCHRFSDWLYSRYVRKFQFHRWFAWRPVVIDHNDCRWLEFVERKRLVSYHYALKYNTWEYREIK